MCTTPQARSADDDSGEAMKQTGDLRLSEGGPPDESPASDPRSASSSDDLSAFRCDQGYETLMATKPDLTTVPVRKPSKQLWINILGEEWRFPAHILVDELDGRSYLLTPAVALSLDDGLAKSVTLTAYTDRAGVTALLPVANVNPDGSSNSWHESMREIVALHTGQWIRIHSSRPHGAYLVTRSPVDLPPPEMPSVGMEDLVRIAFKGRMVDHPAHPLLKRLRGEV